MLRDAARRRPVKVVLTELRETEEELKAENASMFPACNGDKEDSGGGCKVQ